MKNYRNHLQTLLLDGFNLDHDALLWIPGLEALSNVDWETIIPPNDYLRTVGSMSIAKLAIAAVEQYNAEKKLDEGTVEKLRAIAVFLFIDMSNKAALVSGQSGVLTKLKDDFPEFADWADPKISDFLAIAKTVRSEAAAKALGLMRMIQQQQQSKRKGNPGRDGLGFLSSKAALLYSQAIAEVINIAAQSVKARSPLSASNPDEIRREIRQVVLGAVALGLFVEDVGEEGPPTENTVFGLVDVISRKANRKFDADVELYIKQGRLVVPSKSKHSK